MGILVPGDAVSGTFLAGVRLRSHFPMARDLPRLFLPPNFICKCSTLHCRRIAPTLFPLRGNNREDNIFPYNAPKFLRQKFGGTDRVGVVRPAANQNKMIAGGDHSIIQRLIAARQRGRFLGRTVTHPLGLQCREYSIFRHDTAEFCLQIFDTALSALCADVVFPMGKQPGGYYPLCY